MAAFTLNYPKIIAYFLRYSIGISFLSAVADRFGLWGGPGADAVAWGNFENFIAYTGIVNSFLPQAVIPVLAWLATILEIALGVFLLMGFRSRETAFVSGLLLLTFALAMCLSMGIKPPLNYSVFSACAAAFALAYLESHHKTNLNAKERI